MLIEKLFTRKGSFVVDCQSCPKWNPCSSDTFRYIPTTKTKGHLKGLISFWRLFALGLFFFISSSTTMERGTDSQSEETNGYYHSLNEDVLALKQAWLNEQSAPEILPFKEQAVEQIKELLSRQVSRIMQSFMHSMHLFKWRTFSFKELNLTYDYDAFERLKSNWYQQEMQRIKYILSAYLQLRLEKVWQF